MTDHTLTLTHDTLWPWSVPMVGIPLLIAVALLLTVLTIWTYVGVPGARPRRVAALLAFRLFALGLIFLALWRPSLALRDEIKVPSLLILAVDSSASMSIQDELDGQSRWAYAQRMLQRAEPALDRLRTEQNVNVVLYRFGADIAEYDPAGLPEDRRTDFGQALHALLDRYGSEKYLRGLILLSDGADNGTRHQPLTLAQRWRNLPCPVHAVGLGKATTGDKQNDIAVVAVTPDKSPVPINTDFVLRTTVDAPGFENAKVRVQVKFDDKEVLAQDENLPLTLGNELKLKVRAPDKPGEIRVTVRVQPLPGEVTETNNEITTYVTVAKEGISVLLVDKERYPEPQFILDALRNDPRIRLSHARLRGDQPLDPNQLDLFRFQTEHYDVIILGDVTADRLRVGGPNALSIIHQMVSEKGAGLMMMGGFDSFGPSWAGTEIEKLLPVKLDPANEQIEDEVKMMPTEAGLRHFIMKLADNQKDNEAVWEKLRTLKGMTKLGESKEGATVLARAGDPKTGRPMLVGQSYGSGRTLAFAGDTTYRWVQDDDGQRAHARFWKQVILWLAKQEEAEGSVWVKPDTRRLASGSKLGLSAGIRGKTGVDLKDGEFELRVVSPQGAETRVPTAQDKNESRATFYKTDEAGEYKVLLHGKAKDVDGKDVEGDATARVIVYQDETELLRRAADHEFLKKLATTGGGKFHRPEELNQLLQDMEGQVLMAGQPKPVVWPDWRSNQMSEFFPLFLLVFTALLGAEWFLRRRWGLV